MSFEQNYPMLGSLRHWMTHRRNADYAVAKTWRFKIQTNYFDAPTIIARIERRHKEGTLDLDKYNIKCRMQMVSQNRSVYRMPVTIYAWVHFYRPYSGLWVRHQLAKHLLIRIRDAQTTIETWPWGTFSSAWRGTRAQTRKMAIARMSGTGPIAPPITFRPSLWREDEPAPAPIAPVRRGRDGGSGGGRKRPRVDVFFTEQE